MGTAKKKSAPAGKAKAGKKAEKGAPKVSWGDAMKQALAKKKQPAWPEQGKPRDTTVQKVKKDAF